MKKREIDNKRYPHEIRIVRKVIADRYSEEETEIVIYEGAGRSYTDTTTTGDAKVDTNKRKASIPVRFDEWGTAAAQPQRTEPEDGEAQAVADPFWPMSGDMVHVKKGELTEVWEVKDFEPDNNRSVIYGEMSRNKDV